MYYSWNLTKLETLFENIQAFTINYTTLILFEDYKKDPKFFEINLPPGSFLDSQIQVCIFTIISEFYNCV